MNTATDTFDHYAGIARGWAAQQGYTCVIGRDDIDHGPIMVALFARADDLDSQAWARIATWGGLCESEAVFLSYLNQRVAPRMARREVSAT